LSFRKPTSALPAIISTRVDGSGTFEGGAWLAKDTIDIETLWPSISAVSLSTPGVPDKTKPASVGFKPNRIAPSPVVRLLADRVEARPVKRIVIDWDPKPKVKHYPLAARNSLKKMVFASSADSEEPKKSSSVAGLKLPSTPTEASSVVPSTVITPVPLAEDS